MSIEEKERIPISITPTSLVCHVVGHIHAQIELSCNSLRRGCENGICYWISTGVKTLINAPAILKISIHISYSELILHSQYERPLKILGNRPGSRDHFSIQQLLSTSCEIIESRAICILIIFEHHPSRD